VVSFGEPRVLALLVVPAVTAVTAVLRHMVRLRQQRQLASPAVWDRVMGGVPATGLIRLLMWCGAAALLVLALARPQWGELPGEESVRTRDVVLALDVSDSMLATDLPPMRLARCIETTIRLLPLLEGNRVGVVVFAGEAYPLVPLTTDLDAVAVFLGGIHPGMVARPGSNIEAAVAAALELLPTEGEGRVLVMVTDGENLQGDVDAAVTSLKNAGVGALTVIAGTERGGPIPVPGNDGSVQYKRDRNGQPVITRAHPEVLAAIADAVDGEAVPLDDRRVVNRLAEAIARVRTREIEAQEKVQRVERFPLFLVAAAAALATGFLLSPWRRLAVAAAIVGLIAVAPAGAQQGGQPAVMPQPQPPPPATAAPAEHQSRTLPEPSWWQRLIPGGSRRLARQGAAEWRSGKLDESVQSFAGAAMLEPKDPERLFDLGTALGAAGALDAAAPMLEQAYAGGVPDAAYNSGTAALTHQQAENAVRWLREAVLANPDDVEAKRNYELALRLLEQQQQQQQKNQDDQQQKNEDQDQDDKQDQGQQPTPTPSAAPGEPQPTPTPSDNEALFQALERAEAEAREAMQSPTPQAVQVEKDW
jgi:Ca-activated chloride channel family protein